MVRRVVLAEWVGCSEEVLRRMSAKFGLPASSPIDLREFVNLLFRVLRSNEKKISGEENSPRDELAQIEAQIEVETKRQKLEQLRAKTGILKREWVKVSDLQDRVAVAARALRSSGEQLGHRFGPDAQEVFNGALDVAVGALLSIQPTIAVDEEAAVIAAVLGDEASGTAVGDGSQPLAEAPVKRKRGRPRKIRPGEGIHGNG
jgi:hypothetical protein